MQRWYQGLSSDYTCWDILGLGLGLRVRSLGLGVPEAGTSKNDVVYRRCE